MAVDLSVEYEVRTEPLMTQLSAESAGHLTWTRRQSSWAIIPSECPRLEFLAISRPGDDAGQAASGSMPNRVVHGDPELLRAWRGMRRTCARVCHLAGGELDQIQFLVGHVSIQTAERQGRVGPVCRFRREPLSHGPDTAESTRRRLPSWKRTPLDRGTRAFWRGLITNASADGPVAAL